MYINVSKDGNSHGRRIELQKVYEAFYVALPENNRYFLSILPLISEVYLTLNWRNECIECNLYLKFENECLEVMPVNLDLYSKVFKELHSKELMN